jgi:hypothetical protein
LECVDFAIDTNALFLGLQVSFDGGSTFDTTANYHSTYFLVNPAGSTTVDGAFAFWHLTDTLYYTATYPQIAHNVSLRFWRPWSTTLQKNYLNDAMAFTSGGNPVRVTGSGFYPLLGGANLASPITGFRLMLSAAGNLTKGTFRLYGVQN